MATLDDLKTRIRLETGKDDIADGGEAEAALDTAIERAVEFYAERRFWFNQDSGTASTVASTAYVNTPYAVRVPEVVSYSGTALRKRSLSEFQHLTDTGQPLYWDERGDRIYLYPIPNAVYALSVYGIAQIDAPTSGSDETVWTNEAYDLIAARTRFLLYRDQWTDMDRMTLAAQAEAEALDRLETESRRRSRTMLRHKSEAPWLRAITDSNGNTIL